jgi:hypothetical protein
MITPHALDAAVREIASLGLPKVSGFAANAANRIILVGLANGAWILNAARSKERCEAAEMMLADMTAAIGPVLERHLPGQRWRVHWIKDDWGYFRDTETVLKFEWEEQSR